MKLKTNKTSTKGSRTKIRNKKNKDWSRNINNKDSQAIILEGWERKRKGVHQWQIKPPTPTCATLHERKHGDTSYDMWKGIFGYWEVPHMLYEVPKRFLVQKSLWNNQKAHWLQLYFFFAFKSILFVSLCILIFFSWYYNNKKSLYKYKSILW